MKTWSEPEGASARKRRRRRRARGCGAALVGPTLVLVAWMAAVAVLTVYY